MKKENWVDLGVFRGIDFTGLYQISDLGRVKSMPKRCGGCYRKERILNPTPNKKRWGYIYISLSSNGKRLNCLLNRVVAIKFIPNHDNKPQVNHIDGVKSNNSVSNLEWCTDKENKKHGIDMGLLPQCS